MNEVNIEEKQTVYDVALTCHSDMKCQNYDLKIIGIEEENGRVTIKPDGRSYGNGFIFDHSDPDVVIAIAQMAMHFAQMAKNNNKKGIDVSETA